MEHLNQQSNHPSDHSVSQDDDNISGSTARPSLLRPSHDVTSDNEASEGPVREKLKKTSIASMPKEHDIHRTSNTKEEQTHPHSGGDIISEPSAIVNPSDTNTEDRGRLLRKRSFEDWAFDKGTQAIAGGTTTLAPEGRERKRSKDVHTGRIPRVDAHEQGIVRSPVPEEAEVDEGANLDEQSEPGNLPNNHSEQNPRQPAADEDVLDQEMEDHPFSPRKKRSRDPLDADPDREQKMVATEEARAHRRSEEYERNENLPAVAKEERVNGTITKRHAHETAEDLSTEETHRKSGFSDTSVASPFATLTSPKSPPEVSSNSTDELPNLEARTSSAAFTSPSFEALSKSSASPFGSLAPIGSTRTFGSTTAETHSQSEDPRDRVQPSTSNGTERPTNFTSTSSAFGVMAPSPFGSVGLQSSAHSGGNTFGSNFNTNSFGGAKLTSFAAPGADITWGGKGSIKPLGATVAKKSDDENSDSDGDHEEPAEDEIGDDERDTRFRQRDVDTGEEGEHTMFTANRANLYAFEGSWKERGRGVFKLNVATSEPEGSGISRKKGRFIMRAHQTYRILLNTPVFKQMQVGDIRGNEPSGKQVSLAVIEGGKPTPYLIKLSDKSEAMSLYQEIRKLQEEM